MSEDPLCMINLRILPSLNSCFARESVKAVAGSECPVEAGDSPGATLTSRFVNDMVPGEHNAVDVMPLCRSGS